jgi:hypothetical protein
VHGYRGKERVCVGDHSPGFVERRGMRRLFEHAFAGAVNGAAMVVREWRAVKVERDSQQ